MITTIFLGIITYIFQFFFSMFPVGGGFSSEMQTAITTFAGYTTIINALVPMSTLGTILGLVITFELAVFGFKSIRFIWGYVPWIGGKG